MGTCPNPCDTSKDGICVVHHDRCDNPQSIAELRAIIEESGTVAITPDDTLFTEEALEGLASTVKGFELSRRADGVIEISNPQ